MLCVVLKRHGGHVSHTSFKEWSTTSKRPGECEILSHICIKEHICYCSVCHRHCEGRGGGGKGSIAPSPRIEIFAQIECFYFSFS